MIPFKGIEYATKQIVKGRGLEVVHVERVRNDDAVRLTLRRRSFEATGTVRIPFRSAFEDATPSNAAEIFDCLHEAINVLDIQLRTDELRAVFDFADGENFQFGHLASDERRRIGNNLLIAFARVVHGDSFLRNRVVEMAIMFGNNDAVATLIEQKQQRAQLIADMEAADCEQLALDLMARVDRLGKGGGA